MRWLLTIAALAALMLATSAPAAPPRFHAARHATLRTFAGTWFGHTRSLVITRHGFARESIGDGCCDPVIDLKFRLSRVQGTTKDATARARVTAVRVRDHSAYSKKHPPPHVGEVRRIRLRHGVIHEHITGTTYCNRATGRKGVCGA
jgi:hypothetical protein